MIGFNENSVEVPKTEIDYPLALLKLYTRINIELDKLSNSVSSDKDTVKNVRCIINKEVSSMLTTTITIK